MPALSPRWLLLARLRPFFTTPTLIVQRPQWLSLVVVPPHSRAHSDVTTGMAQCSEADQTSVQAEPSSDRFGDTGLIAEESTSGSLVFVPFLVAAAKNFDAAHGLTREEGTLGATLVKQIPTRLATQLRELFDFAPRPPDTRYILNVLHFLQQNKGFDLRFVYPAAKLMALLLTDRQATATLNGDTSLRGVWDELLKFLNSELAKLAIPTVRCSTLLYLRLCADPTLLERIDNWPAEIPSFAWKDVLEASHCFRLLVSIALVQAPTPQARGEWLRGVCRAGLVIPRETFYSPEPPLSIWPNFFDALTSDVTGDGLMSTFFDQMASLEIFDPAMPEFREFVSPALKKHARWRLLPARPTADGRCNVCSHQLQKRPTLMPAEFDQLREEFNNLLVKASKSGSVATTTDYDAFLRFMDRLKQSVRPDKRPAVIDGLNVLYSSWTSLVGFHQSLFTLAEDGYSPILLSIRRPRSRQEKEMVGRLVEAARSINAHYFFVDKRSLDDYFLINAAMALGPQAEVLSNDEFADHGDSMADPASRRLLDIWCRSNIIRLTHDRKCLYPSMYYKAVQKSPSGYHLSVLPRDKYGYKFIHLPFSYCLQTGTGSAADNGERPSSTGAETS